MKLFLAICLSMSLAVPSPAQQEAFPTGKSITLKQDDKSWYVDERATIASNVSVVSLRATTIAGRAKDSENVILLSGSLELKAVKGGRVVLDNIWIELTPDAKSLYLSQCEFRGGGVRVSDKTATTAKVFMEFTDFGVGANLSLTMKAGSLDLQASSSILPVIFKGLPVSDKQPNKSSVSILTCSGTNRALFAGLEVVGISDVLVRNSDLRGELTRIVDCPVLDFDGNNVRSTKLYFGQAVYGSFSSTKVHNCDFRGSKIEFRTPAPEKKLEPLTIDHCWFKGITDPAAIRAGMVIDNATDATTGVTINFQRTSAGALGLAGR